MIKKTGHYVTDLRSKMRGGEGVVKIEHFWDASRDLQGAFRLFAKLTIEPECSIGFHRHEDEAEVFVVLSGVGEVDDDGTPGMVRAGDTILTGFGAGHAIRCAGNEPLVLLAVISGN